MTTLTRGTPTGLPPEPTHYTALSLPQALLLSSPDPTSLVKKAYRRALLRHHPDKQQHRKPEPSCPCPSSFPRPTRAPPAPPAYTIDQITTAYATLSSPSSRQSYNKSLLLRPQQASQAPTSPPAAATGHLHATGIETIDLDDLSFSPSTSSWTRPCRCGNDAGFEITEGDLEAEVSASSLGHGGSDGGSGRQKFGELVVGCKDCSLWLRVHFAVMEEDEQEHGG
ncbi:hypothetical protein MKZ38_002819 [Zalerion maritima]|uniref:Diphthamide biosynthesis protein 4 n=1 Tax=Zalerion maritima TaxID=339359 RepID=A0AAD5RPF6_9PEZI|nr:hypothetical protein MKZ38_002819 [Zalerion maritima]